MQTILVTGGTGYIGAHTIVDLIENGFEVISADNLSRSSADSLKGIEKITGKKFPKVRPNFLMNTVSGSNLELDCYNDEMKIAVEYNGEQHYNYIPYFHNNKDAFTNLKYRDEKKRLLCKKNGILLITVPYTVKHRDIETYIIKELKKYYS